ncbi:MULTISPECIES: acyltransferase [unclassified Caballeronia]|uniref:acyltransferase family protein n=1 Tax=unclassified Caballeronia TaxID=2646786 RepID=UPI002028BF14|nr:MULTISPECIES: acyltransferase [unclassified Caballeronia]
MSSRQHIEAFDGLRALAVGCVVVTHYANADSVLRKIGVDWAIIGVHLFFVLSGFLITKSLKEKYFVANSFGSGFGAFLLARCFRIVPLAYAVIAIVGILSVEPLPPGFYRDNLLFISNFYTVRTGLWFPYLGHYWSLAVEMQFYLIFPAFVWVFRRNLIRALVVALSFTLLLQVAVGHYGKFVDPRFLLSTRADAFLWGSVVFCLSDTKWFMRYIRIMIATGGILFIGQSVGIAWFALKPAVAQMTVGNIFFSGILGAAMLPGSWFVRVLQNRFFRHLGKVSFGIYVWHPVMWLLWANAREFDGGLPYKMLDVMPLWMLLTLATVICAELSWLILETPANRLGHRLASKALRARPALTSPTSIIVTSINSPTKDA